jgi:uncharacterized protein (DUF1499 family)
VSLWYAPSVVVLLLVGAGVIGAHGGLVEPVTGFRWFFWGIGIATLTLLPFGVALLLRPLRGAAARGICVPLLVVLAALLPNASALHTPQINDITTDLEDTLQFSPDVAAAERTPARGDVLAEQRRAYPDVAPLRVRSRPAETFLRAAEVARGMRHWHVTSVDAVRMRIQAHQTSRLFRFKDDVIIRVSPAAEGERGSRIDIRSRSRVGRSDLGVNAARIRAYLAAYQAAGFR